MRQSDNESMSKSETDTNWMETFTAGRLALVIGLLLFALYPGVLLGTQTFFYQDYGLFTYPLAHYAHQSLWRGEVPLWNPLNNCGVPFLAQWNTSVCYPLSLIYLLLPLPWSLNIFCLGHLVLAGTSMYLLAFRWTQNRLAASIAGLAFGLNGLMLNCLLWTGNPAALSWQPLVVLGVERAWRQGGFRQIALAALAGAMQMLSGAVELVLCTWIMLVILWLCEAGRKSVPLWPSLGRLTATVTLVAALAAVQILPFLDLLAHSERDSSYAAAETWPLAFWGLANFVVPHFHASQSVLGTHHLAGQYWTKAYYLGVGVLILAAAGLWRERRLRVFWLGGMALAGLVLALGDSGFVYAWLKHVVPALGFARYPIKFVAIPVFALPLLAAYGLSSLQAESPERSRHGRRILILAGGSLGLIAGWTLWASRRCPVPGESWQLTWQSALSRMVFLAGFVAAVCGLLFARTPRVRVRLAVIVTALLALDLVTAGLRIHPTVVTRAFGPIEFNMSFSPRLGEARALVSQRAQAWFNRAGTRDPIAYCVGIRGAMFEDSNLLEGCPKVDGFYPLSLKEQVEACSMVDAGTNRLVKPLADFLGVAQVITPDNPFGWQSRSDYLPLVTTGQRPRFAEDSETLQALASDNFEPRREVYLPTTTKTEVRATNGAEARIMSTEWAAQHVRFSVEAPAPAMVVIAQSFYHNWHSFVDGRPVRLWRANHAFQALEVPAGRHVVSLVYQDRAFHLGAIISALALIACLVFLKRTGGPGAEQSPL